MNKQEEQDFRENIRTLIKLVKTKKSFNESRIRSSLKTLARLELQRMISEREVADTDPTPNKSTGINILEDLLKKIVPVLEVDYKSLTTSDEQRQSFRAHVINAIVATLTPVEANNLAGEEASQGTNPAEVDDIDEEINIDVGDDAGADDDKFIDIRTDAEIAADEETEEEDPVGDFGIEGQDETGRNMAYNSFKKIETSIIDSYELLSNPEDQELFYDYLIANTKLYFDKFEDELTPELSEPTNQAYATASQDLDSDSSEEELEIEL
jgi:hypothetical protein